MTVKALETHYAGCRFRSRLEARWAVFFDHLGIRWEYEPQGFLTPDGPYLPDFALSLTGGQTVWFEVKGNTDTTDDPRWSHLVIGTQRPLVLACGLPRPADDLCWGGDGFNGWMQEFDYSASGVTDDIPVSWDNGRAFCVCPICDGIGIEFEGRAERLACCRIDGDKIRTYDHPRIVNAYRAAHSARFEHGERG